MRLPALLYHHVGPAVSDQGIATPADNGRYRSALSVPSDSFERQMGWLVRHGYSGIRPADWLAWREGRGSLPRKPILLTFDDGYADFPNFVLPVLRRYGFGAAVFVISRRIGARNSWDGALLMNADQIRDCGAHGIEIGAHTRTHPDLTTLSGPSLAEEIDGSAADIADIIGTGVTSFAYPYGRWNDEVRARVRESFDLAFTCEEGVNDDAIGRDRLRRTMVLPGDWPVDFACRARFGWSPVTALRTQIASRISRSAGAPRQRSVPPAAP